MSSRISPPLLLTAGGLVVGVLLAGCGGSGGYGGGSSPNPPAGAAAVATRTGATGSYLTDGTGRTLYLFTADKGATSSCSGDCASEWMPFTSAGTPKADGFDPAVTVATTKRTDGTSQVVYAGHPLYYFAGDSAAGQVNGQGLSDFGGSWYVVTPSGTAAKGATSPATSPSSNGYSYSY